MPAPMMQPMPSATMLVSESVRRNPGSPGTDPYSPAFASACSSAIDLRIHIFAIPLVSVGRVRCRPLVIIGSKLRHDIGDERAGAILARTVRAPDMDEPRDSFVSRDAKPRQNSAVIGVPSGKPSRGKPERVRGDQQVHAHSPGR